MSNYRVDREQVFQLAINAGKQRNYKKAISLLESLVVDGVAWKPEILIYLGRSYHAIGEFSLAVAALNYFLSIKSGDWNGWFFLGRSYLAMESWNLAISCLKKSLELNPDSDTTLALLGTAYYKSKQIDLALSTFEKALYIAPDDVRLNQGYQNSLLIKAVKTYNEGQVELAGKMFHFLIENGMKVVMLYVYQGHSFRDLGLLEQALASYQQAIQLEPDDASLRWYEISILVSMGKKVEAENLAKELNKVFPNSGFGTDQIFQDERSTIINMIKTSIFAEKWKSVLQSGKLYISKFSSDTFIHCFMGEACRNLGRYQEALNHFVKAKTLEASNKGAIYGILMTYLAMEDWENLDQALNSSSYANYLDSDTIEYYSVICDAKLKKDSTQILKKVQDVYSKNPTDIVLMSILAEAYLDSGLPDLATGWFNRLISIDSENESSYLFLIDCYEELDDKTKLTKSYENYLKKWPQNISIRKEFIKYLALQEKWKKAADNIELLIPYSKHPMMLTRNLATYRRRSGDYQKSAMAYRTLLQEKTDDRAIMHKYIFCLVKLDLCKNALNFAKLWHKNYGIDVDGALIEAGLAVKIKDYDYAISILRSAFAKFKENPRIKTKLAQVYYEMGNDDMAYQFDSDYVIKMRKSNTKSSKNKSKGK